MLFLPTAIACIRLESQPQPSNCSAHANKLLLNWASVFKFYSQVAGLGFSGSLWLETKNQHYNGKMHEASCSEASLRQIYNIECISCIPSSDIIYMYIYTCIFFLRLFSTLAQCFNVENKNLSEIVVLCIEGIFSVMWIFPYITAKHTFWYIYI